MRGAALAAVLLLAGCAATPDEGPRTVTVFAAASLTESFDELAAAFGQANPDIDVVLSYGGSAALAIQISEGAPADVFAAANVETMRQLTDGYDVFATNRLEIAVPLGNPGGVEGIRDLAEPGLAIALCAAEVPCGAAAATVFEAIGLTPAPDTLEEDVKAVLTKVELGEVDAGLVYHTDVLAARGSVEGIPFSQASQAVNQYPITALTPEGAAFADFVRSDEGLAVLERHGFGAP